MSDDTVNIEVNGVPVKARKGQMIMQATDPADIYIPRFCYHDKLSIAANCRMCLVEVEKAPKPLPACATPVTEGMKVFTKSPKAVAAQRATMEFLLINHPLDCPICDQGGECELQDLALGYGRDISRFSERKRVVKDKNLGPLVSTDMTRCIHCTRCVRFGAEIQGYPQMGATGRGEHMEIGTYIEHSVDHELSANIIDLCPVGALNNKPFRYHARSWEMTQAALVSPHDAFGTNLFAHVLRGKLMRMVPRENEAINETWIADRDRFGFEGIYSADRVSEPMLRIDGTLQVVDWEVALTAAAQGLQKATAAQGGASVGFLASPLSTVEELYLLAQVARGLGCGNIDHRLRQLDFRAQENDSVFPSLGLQIADVEKLEGVLIIGSNLRHEMPLLAHRVRKVAVKVGGAKVAFLNPRHFDYMFPVAAYLADTDLVGQLTAMVQAAASAFGKPVPTGVASVPFTDVHRAAVAALANGTRHAIILGTLAQRHPAYSQLKALAGMLAELSGASLGTLTEGANGAGAYLAGAVPHREAGGAPAATVGLSARAMLESALQAYVLLGGLDPAVDLGVDAQALHRADLVVAITTHLPENLRDIAHVVLPIGSFAETSGTYVSAEGRWQSWAAAVKLPGEARPGWKVLRVLANLLSLPGMDYMSSEQIRDALRAACETRGDLAPAAPVGAVSRGVPNGQASTGSWIDIPPYQSDVLVRGSDALARTKDGLVARMTLYAMWDWTPLRDFLSGLITPYWTFPLLTLVQAGMVTVGIVLTMAMYTYFERKVIGWMQVRRGPNRVGPLGLAQPFADVIKLMFKEILIPADANGFLFRVAPFLSLVPALAIWAVIPLRPEHAFANIDAGLLYVLALTSMGVYGIILAGWASNSKYGFLGAMRSAAQIVAYEIAMGFAMVGVLMAAGSLNIGDIIHAQSGMFGWNWTWLFPLFIVYFISGVAETNRAPFDVAEGESEIVAGFHVDYSGMAFALFFVAEYVNMILISALTVIFFLGGWLSPFDGWSVVPQDSWLAAPSFFWFGLKTLFPMFTFLWFRATFPRYRYDQIMRLGWKALIPVTLVWLLVEGVMVYFQVGPWKVH